MSTSYACNEQASIMLNLSCLAWPINQRRKASSLTVHSDSTPESNSSSVSSSSASESPSHSTTFGFFRGVLVDFDLGDFVGDFTPFRAPVLATRCSMGHFVSSQAWDDSPVAALHLPHVLPCLIKSWCKLYFSSLGILTSQWLNV